MKTGYSSRISPLAMSKPRPRILVADDDKVTRLKLCHILEQDVGAEVLIADDGEQAWEIFIADESIQFIISDWVMPQCDGPQLCARVREQKNRPYTYFILATAKGKEEDLVKGLALGADDYIRKPIHGAELQARVNAGLRVVELERSLAMRNSELEQALTAASQMQQDMLPNAQLLDKIRRESGLEIAFSYQACESLGGDVLRIVDAGKGVTLLLLGDVSGHGIPASLAAVGLSAFFQMQSVITCDLRELLLKAHNYCTSEFPTGVYATAIMLSINGAERSVEGVIAGHPPLYYVQHDGTVEKFTGEIAPLGLFSEPPENLQSISLRLAPGERLIAYSDGIVETRNAAGEMYADHSLQQAVTAATNEPLVQMLNHVLEDVAAWRGAERPAEDDITLLALQFEAAP